MQITVEQSRKLNELFSMDIHLIDFYLDKQNQFYLDKDHMDGLISKFCEENSIEIRLIKQIIFNLTIQNKVNYIPYLHINSPGYKDYISVYFYISQDVGLTSFSLEEEITNEQIIKHIISYFADESNKIYRWINEEIDQISRKKIKFVLDYVGGNNDKLISLALELKEEIPKYNKIILYYLKQTQDIEKVKMLISSKEIKLKLSKSPERPFEIFYDDFYDFLNPEKKISDFTDFPAFSYLLEHYFSLIEKDIKTRNHHSIYYSGHNLKNFCESLNRTLWKHSLGQFHEIGSEFLDLQQFGYRLMDLKKYFLEEYYMKPELEKRLIEYLTYLKESLFSPLFSLFSEYYQEDRISTFEHHFRYLNIKDFREIINEIETDFNSTKTIKTICERRFNPDRWENGNLEQFETSIKEIIKTLPVDIEENIKFFTDSTEIDFLVSDKRNRLMAIECKSGSNANSTNEAKKFLIPTEKAKITNKIYIIDNVIEEQHLRSIKDFCSETKIIFFKLNNNEGELKKIIKELLHLKD